MSAENLARLRAKHGETRNKFQGSNGGGTGDKKEKLTYLNLRNDLPDGETRIRVIPADVLTNPYDTFLYRGKHRGIRPPTEWELKKNPDAAYHAVTCNMMFDDYCHVCDLVNRLADESDKDLRAQAEYHNVIEEVYFNIVKVDVTTNKLGNEIFVANTSNKNLRLKIESWFTSSDFDNQEYMHPKLGKALKITRTSKERKDGKTQVDMDIEVGLKTLALPENLIGRNQNLKDRILTQVDDDKVIGWLTDLYPEFVS